MSNDEIEAHPVVAALAASIVQSEEGLMFAEGAVDAARSAMRATLDETIALHLAALAAKAKRIGGPVGARLLLEDILALLTEYVGREQALAKLEEGGLTRDTATAIGASVVTRAPEPQRAPPPTSVKPKRGLEK